MSTTSRTVAGKSQSTVSSWGTHPTPSLRPDVTTLPSNQTRPRSLGTAPTMARSRVVLPAPLGPTTPTSAPRGIARSTSSSTAGPP
jgi:hypothetical protein